MSVTRAVVVAATVGSLFAASPLTTASATPSHPVGPLTVAVYGDSPYGVSAYAPANQAADTTEYEKSPAFIGTINADPSVSEVIHVGDVHSGKQFCTEEYDNQIASLWQDFNDPLVYTPGDNEWTDCHKVSSVTSPGEGGGFYSGSTLYYIAATGLTTDPTQCVDYRCGNPVDNLALIRQTFFSQPGHTLGSGSLGVVSQAAAYDPSFPTDAQYVENVMWAQTDVVFVTINVPGGSNNDADVWYKAPAATQAQIDERLNRTGADIRWLDAAFAVAQANHAKGVVITDQADMWDLDGKTPSHLTNYDPIISEIAAKTLEFRRPVLMFNGDSHLYRSDNPMSQYAPCTGEIDPATGQSVCLHDPKGSAWYEHQSLNLNVPNFHRVVVHGSTTPLEWLKLTIDPDANYQTTGTTFGPFSWQRKPQPQL
ncbi:MAG: hypothetical protein ACXVQ0_05145 [Actinomycetota bacterium]